MRILVTGGAGFIGSNLCENLLKDGHEVIALDNLYTGTLANLRVCRENPMFRFVEHDVRAQFDADVDQIYHLACPASPVHYQADPIMTIQTAFLGTMNALELATRTGARLLVASTSEVYGDPLMHPQLEAYWGNVNPIGVRSCYDEGKRAAETLVSDYRRTRGTDARIVRIFNTYGPRMRADDGRVVSNFIVQALREEPLTVYGQGLQTRSFCYISDLIEGFKRVMMAHDFAGPVNLGNPNEFTVAELAERIVGLTGSSAGIIHKPLPADDPTRRRPDISLAKKLLGWEPKVVLEQGLINTVAYFRQIILGVIGQEAMK